MLLQMTDITKSFGGVPVLRGVSFALEAGQIHALVGHNGAGKSTLMKVLGGLYADHGGLVKIDGRAARLTAPHEAHRHGVATIYQDFALVPDMSVADNIALGREPKGFLPGLLSHSALRARSAREAEALGIDLPMETSVRELGVATQQMTEIVRALSQNARILIMDEPTARLAPAEREHLFSVMRRMAAAGMGIIYISHFLEEVIALADHVTVLRDGRVVTADTADRFSVDSLARLLVGEEEAAFAQQKAPPVKTGDVRLELSGFVVGGARPSDLTIRAGEIVGLAGLIGSGRTRLARAMIGDVLSKGGIKVDGRDLRPVDPGKAARAGLILLPEDRKVNGLVLTGTIRENVQLTALGGRLSKRGLVRRRAGRDLVRQAIERFHIRPAEPDRNVSTLSGGNAQKVLLARAASASPHVLILDQPTAGVDIGAKAELHKQIRQLAAEGAAVLLISDDLDELLDLSNRIAVITTGSIRYIADRRGMDRASLLAEISRNVSSSATSVTEQLG